VLVATGVSGIVLLGILSAYMVLLRGALRASDYSVMETQSRRTLEQLGIDARMANAVYTGNGTNTNLVLTVPNNYLGNSNQVTYGYDATNKYIYKIAGNYATNATMPSGGLILLGNVTSCAFTRYGNLTSGNTTLSTASSDGATRLIQVAITVTRTNTGSANATENIVSAAFTLRN
jgi:hypothetical protein